MSWFLTCAVGRERATGCCGCRFVGKPLSMARMTVTTILGRPRRMSRVRWAYLLMFASAMSFATMSACASGLKTHCDWRVVAAARAGLAFAITWPVAKMMGVPLVWRAPRTLWMRSIVGSIGMVCTFFSLTHLPVSGSVTLLNTFPLWVALLSWPVLGAKPTLGSWLAVATGMAGIAMIALSNTHAKRDVDHVELATGLALVGSLTAAVVMLGLHRLRGVHPMAIAVHFGGLSTIACVGYLAATVWLDRPLGEFATGDVTTWLLLGGMGLCGALGQILMTTAFQHGMPDRLSIIGLSQSVFALGYDLVFWQHPLDAWLIGGMIGVLAPGAWLVAHRGRPAIT
jgi:drug/metabolite transporter (DMT)-like permease